MHEGQVSYPAFLPLVCPISELASRSLNYCAANRFEPQFVIKPRLGIKSVNITMRVDIGTYSRRCLQTEVDFVGLRLKNFK
jgi:hypothetical protein